MGHALVLTRLVLTDIKSLRRGCSRTASMLRRTSARALSLAATIAACGAADQLAEGPPRDLTIRLSGEAAHPDRLAEFAVIDSRGALAARAVLRGYAADDSLTLPATLSPGSGWLEWFFDTNASLAYEPPPSDRSGRTPISPQAGAQAVSVSLDAPPVDITRARSDGATLTGRFTEFEVHVGVFFELRVVDEQTLHTVGFFRYRALPAGGRFNVVLRGILRDGVRYTAEWFIDLNDNGVYDPRGDHSGSLSFVGRADDILFHHMHHTNRTWAE